MLLVGAGGVLGSLIGGWCGGRWGPWATLTCGTLLNIPVLIALSQVDEAVAAIALAALSVAISQSFVGPAATIVSLSATQELVRAFAFYRIFLNVGSVTAPAIAGLVGPNSFPLLFVLSAVGSAVTLVVLVASRGVLQQAVAQDGGDGGASTEKAGTGHGSAGTRRRLALVIVAFGIAIAVYAQHQSGIPLSLERLENGLRLFSVLLIINPLVIIFLEMPLSLLTSRVSWSTALASGILLSGAGLAVTGLASSWTVCIVGFVVFSLGEAIFAPMAGAAVAQLSHPTTLSRNQGYLSAAQAVGLAVGPAAGAAAVLANRPLFWAGVVVLSTVAAAAVAVSGTGRTGEATIPDPVMEGAVDHVDQLGSHR